MISSHFAVKVISAVIAVLTKLNFVSPLYQPRKLYPTLAGFTGEVTFSPDNTVLVVHVSPSFTNVTVTPVSHLAVSSISSVIGVLKSNLTSPLYQPAKANSSFVGFSGALTAFPLVTVLVV